MKIADVNGNSIVDFLGDAGYLKARASPSDTALATSTLSTADIKAKPAVEASLPPPVLPELPFPASGNVVLSHFDSPAHFYLQDEDCIVAAVELQSAVDAQVAESQSFAETGLRPDVGQSVCRLAGNFEQWTPARTTPPITKTSQHFYTSKICWRREENITNIKVRVQHD